MLLVLESSDVFHVRRMKSVSSKIQNLRKRLILVLQAMKIVDSHWLRTVVGIALLKRAYNV
jgi:hypothetical protein